MEVFVKLLISTRNLLVIFQNARRTAGPTKSLSTFGGRDLVFKWIWVFACALGTSPSISNFFDCVFGDSCRQSTFFFLEEFDLMAGGTADFGRSSLEANVFAHKKGDSREHKAQPST